MALENLLGGKINTEARKELLIVKGNSKQVWEGIIRSNLCPMEFGLFCTCGHPANCQECWEKALELETIDPNVKLSLNGKLYCAKCMEFLAKTATKSGIEIYICPTCHSQWDIKRNDQGNIQAITKRNDEEEPDDSMSSEEVETKPATPSDEDYNEE